MEQQRYCSTMVTPVLVCRVCQTTDNLELIFKKENADILSMLNSVLSSAITYDEAHPPCMCTRCIFALEDIYEFKSLYQKTYNKFKNTSICNERWQGTEITPKRLDNTSSQMSDDSMGFLPDSIPTDDESETKNALSKCYKSSGTSEWNRKTEATMKGKLIKNSILDDNKGLQKIDESADEKSQDESLVAEISISNEPETFHTNVHQAVGSKFKLLYKCDNCEKSFTTSYSLKKHLFLRCNSGPYKSEKCGRSSYSPTSLKEQKLTQSHLKSYVCFKCGRTFTRADYLKYHEAVTCRHSKHDSYRFHSNMHQAVGSKFKLLYKCDNCEKSFTTPYSLKKHLFLRCNSDPYKSEESGRSSYPPTTLKEQKCTQPDLQSYACFKCERTFKRADYLKYHEAVTCRHSKPGSYRCDYCGKSFISEYYFQKHLALHNNPDLYKCKDCGTVYTNATHLKEHQDKKCRSRCQFKCRYCQIVCSSANALRNHEGLCSNAQTSKVQESSNSKRKLYECTECNKSIVSLFRYRAHVALHSNPDIYKCNECGTLCRDSCHLREHKNKLCRSKGPYKCAHCEKLCNSIDALEKHQVLHFIPDLHKCLECGVSLSSMSSLIKHKKNKHSGRVRKCDTCGKVYNDDHLFRAHVALHTNPDLYKCKQCGKSFSCSKTLKVHSAWHTNPDIYKCEVCGKSFTMPHHLRSHLAWHANAYNCMECGKSFAEAAKLKNHQLMHSNPDLHKCEVCGKSFSALNSLRKHLKRHSNPELKIMESPASA